MKIPRSLTLLAVLGVVAMSSGGAAARPCKTDPRVLGDCFRVHGRLGFYNGNPSFRIWRIGTDRILGVQDDEAPIVPDNVATHLSTHTEIFADFVVCPFTVDQPGWMRRVCIESAEHIVVRER